MESKAVPEVGVLPKIVDVEWKLEVSATGPRTGSDNLVYSVILKTDVGEDVKFTCGSQELQDLVYKLKHLVRHCDNIKSQLS